MTASPLHTALYLLLATLVTATVTTVAVRRAHATPPAPVVASVSDLMAGIVAPAAETVFTAVAFEVTTTGEVERGPRSEHDWRQVERSASLLADAALLLTSPGRDARYRRLVNLDRERWLVYAGALRESAIWARNAARDRSTARLLATGGDISFACERCHLDFRYPESRVPGSKVR